MTRRALVLTVSDGVSAGVRHDASGEALDEMLREAGYAVDRAVVADEAVEISTVLSDGASSDDLIVTTGGTGFGPRDVTPEATAEVIDREAHGLVHLMLTRGIESTPMAALSRLRAGAIGSTLVLNVPGSPKGAVESLEAVIDVIPHALDLLGGDTEHQ